MTKISEKIKELRKKNGITQQNMAEFLNVDQSFISKIESSERNLTLEIITKIASLFVCSIDSLLDDTKTVNPMIMPFRRKSYTVQDLTNISDANKIILNFNEMIDLLED